MKIMATPELPSDHAARMDGLSIGDAFGSQFFLPGNYRKHFTARTLPNGEWGYTDDTEMALGIVDVLERYGGIDQYELAQVFARRYMMNTCRGYGAMAHQILTAIATGTPWRNAADGAFDGQGSMGNGSAMRVAPLGAYFADDPERVAQEAAASAEVTHAHAEGKAGAVAIAVAAAWAWNAQVQRHPFIPGRLLASVADQTPAGRTKDRLLFAQQLPHETDAAEVGRIVGNGSQVTAPDTVPFCVWCCDRFLGDYAEALWATLSAGGDIDTTCAIVGGVVALSAPDTIPSAWRANREALA
jgi:ADP-ribosylglycohydrolase